jgi:hypothetical protein
LRGQVCDLKVYYRGFEGVGEGVYDVGDRRVLEVMRWLPVLVVRVRVRVMGWVEKWVRMGKVSQCCLASKELSVDTIS